jgi:hypothetical protein
VRDRLLEKRQISEESSAPSSASINMLEMKRENDSLISCAWVRVVSKQIDCMRMAQSSLWRQCACSVLICSMQLCILKLNNMPISHDSRIYKARRQIHGKLERISWVCKMTMYVFVLAFLATLSIRVCTWKKHQIRYV